MNPDLGFLIYTILASVEKNCSATLLNNPESKNAKIDKIFAIIDSTMLIKNPMYVRRADFTSIRQ